jgi:hypothetical protein
MAMAVLLGAVEDQFGDVLAGKLGVDLTTTALCRVTSSDLWLCLCGPA